MRKLCHIHPRYTLHSFVLIQVICLNKGNFGDTIAVELPLVQKIEKDHFAIPRMKLCGVVHDSTNMVEKLWP